MTFGRELSQAFDVQVGGVGSMLAFLLDEHSQHPNCISLLTQGFS